MSLTRKFLGSRAPALPPTVDYLVDKYRAGDSLDLSGVIVVLPGRRAGRRLLELLARRAADDSLVFYPPEVTTVGALPEELYEPKRPFASELVQGLAWVKAIKAMGRRRLTAFVSRLPADRDLRNWLNLAGVIQRQHNELAADGLDFADVVRAGTKLGGAAEAKRWKLLKDIQQGYLAILDDLGLWDRQTARLFAIEHRECRTERDIVLVATADMNRALRLMLGQVADRVTTLVHAPTAWADRFDPFGCLLPAIWEEVQLPIDPDQVMVVDAPSDQARAVLQFIADLQGEFRIDQVTVGVTDERVVPELQRQFMQYNVPTRWAIGRMLAETTPYRLLEVIGRYVERGRMSDFHALLRHPDVFAWVERQGVEGDWLTQLDRYYQDHLPPKTGDWIGSEQKTADLHAIDDAVSSVLKPLHAEAQPLRTWAAQTAQVLTDFYADVEFDREESVEHYTLEALQHLRAILLEMQAIADDVSPVVSASQAIQVILERLRRIQIAPPPLDQPPLELLGWLELPLDTAPVLVVTSFNEQFVPTSQNSDAFLPNTLREKLGLVDNSRRYARDAYAVSILLESRQKLQLIVAKRDTVGDPLIPSRLLFAVESAKIPARAQRFFQPVTGQSTSTPMLGRDIELCDRSEFVVRQPPPLEAPITSMTVTAFRSYLACPYRFYLRHVLKLEAIDDRADELDARLFGIVLHDVLERFGRHDVHASTSAEEIRLYLQRTANRVARRHFGRFRLPAVDVQLLQLQHRLDAFAKWQAYWANEGWRIKFTEVGNDDQPLDLGDGTFMQVRGRIDRIDQNEKTGEWAVFDYKSSDTGKDPDHAHRTGGKGAKEWVDLQLPLYRAFLPSLGITGSVKLGYIVLPKDTQRAGPSFANWTSAELKEADDVAIQVARNVRDGRFWPPSLGSQRLFTELAAICQESVFDRRFEEVSA